MKSDRKVGKNHGKRWVVEDKTELINCWSGRLVNNREQIRLNKKFKRSLRADSWDERIMKTFGVSKYNKILKGGKSKQEVCEHQTEYAIQSTRSGWYWASGNIWVSKLAGAQTFTEENLPAIIRKRGKLLSLANSKAGYVNRQRRIPKSFLAKVIPLEEAKKVIKKKLLDTSVSHKYIIQRVDDLQYFHDTEDGYTTWVKDINLATKYGASNELPFKVVLSSKQIAFYQPLKLGYMLASRIVAKVVRMDAQETSTPLLPPRKRVSFDLNLTIELNSFGDIDGATVYDKLRLYTDQCKCNIEAAFKPERELKILKSKSVTIETVVKEITYKG